MLRAAYDNSEKADALENVVRQEILSQTAKEFPQEPGEPLLTGRRVPTKTESVSESVDKIIGDCLRLQLFFVMPTKNRKPARKPRTDAAELPANYGPDEVSNLDHPF